MSSLLDDLRGLSAEEGVEFYPGSKKPIVRHPNRTYPEAPDPDRWDVKPIIKTVGGVEMEFFTIGHLAQALRRRPVTIRTWERDKIIPNATFRRSSEDPRGVRRLYTRAQVEGLIQIAEEEGLLKGDNRSIRATDFTKRAYELFRSLAK